MSTDRTPTLPDGWALREVVEDRVLIDELDVGRVGLAATGPTGEQVTGSAAGLGACPRDRGAFELLERVSVLEALTGAIARFAVRGPDGDVLRERERSAIFPESDAPNRYRHARSNGVALYSTWSGACARARAELCERDRVLRSWVGEIDPVRVPTPAPLDRLTQYAVEAAVFPARQGDLAPDLVVAGVFGLPRADAAPFFAGYAARPTVVAALEAAASEALQVLAFSWGEDIPEERPPVSPTPLCHLETFQHRSAHEAIRSWLAGDHRRFARRARGSDAPAGAAAHAPAIEYVDLTPSWISGQLRVARALCGAAFPLVFGEAPFAAHLPEPLRVHPVA